MVAAQVALGCWLLLVGPPSAVEEGVVGEMHALGRPIRFEEVLRSGERAEDVEGAREASSTASAGVSKQPRLTMNPVVSAAIGARVNPSEEQGFEGTVGIAQPLSLRRAGARRKEALRAEARWRAAEVDAAELRRDLEVARAWLELRRAETLHALALEQQEVADARLRALQRLAEVGERQVAEVADAAAERERTRLAVLDAEGLETDASYALARSLGHGDASALRTDGPLPEVVLPAPEERFALLEVVESLPSVRATELRAAAQEAGAEEGWANAGPLMSVGLQAQRESHGSTIVQGTVSVPIPVVRRGTRARTAQRANAAVLRGQAREQAVQLRASVRTMVHDVDHAQRVLDELREHVVPASADALRSWERQAASGEALPLQVLDARRRLVEARRREAVANVDRAWSRVRLAIFVAAIGEQR